MSEELIVVETLAGTNLIGKASDGFCDGVREGLAVTLRDVYRIITVDMPVGPGNVVRITKLAKLDFVDGALPELKVRVSSYYEPTAEAVEKYVLPEIEDIEKRAKKPVQEQPSDLMQARIIPNLPPGILSPRIRR